jgi:F-BAR domain only protein
LHLSLTGSSLFNSPWQKILHSTKSLAQSHQTFAHNIEIDVEKPLRSFASSSRELQDLSSKVVSNLQHTAKEIENAGKRADKLKEKGSKASADKVATAATSIDDARGQWDSEAPLVFEKLQEVDEARWDHLRNSLTQLETYASDMSNSNSVAIQECLNALFEVQTADEIQHFSMKAPGSAALAPPSRHSERRLSQAPQPSLPLPASTALAPPPIPQEDGVNSLRSNSSELTNYNDAVHIDLTYCSPRKARKEEQIGWLKKTRHCYQRQEE